jgi:hypothetical protein
VRAAQPAHPADHHEHRQGEHGEQHPLQGADVLRMARASFEVSRVAEGVVRGVIG